ncbi:DNA-3-methyladenine glycosylase I [Alkalibacterium iburiense]|uniref:DNA-3-methyladenine glycosylase I n=1 Tax=Alkalibacterium iburiense TaxID=290589 RepID=A0ABN0XSY9_9LACT
MVKRCQWVTNEPLYMEYHDKEWGRPLYDDHALFEMLCLEGAQAGLSWWTILQRRDHYREAFDAFDPQKISTYNEEKMEELMQNDQLIRNKLKIKSVISNAEAYMKIVEKTGSFSDYIWQFVNHKPIMNARKSQEDVPASTELSHKMAKQLKKDGFKFVGPTICYAFMQAVGMVNDHLVDCHCYNEINRNDKRASI